MYDLLHLCKTQTGFYVPNETGEKDKCYTIVLFSCHKSKEGKDKRVTDYRIDKKTRAATQLRRNMQFII
jgi:hypothetical protein